MDFTDKKLDIMSLIDALTRQTVLYQVSGISRAFLSENKKPGEEAWHLKTEGVNLHVCQAPASKHLFS